MDDQTDHPLLTLRVLVPGGTILLMAELAETGSTLIARGVHVHAEGLGPNEVGPGNLRSLAVRVLEEMGYDELIVEGADRTTGAGPGRRPGRLRFTRRLRPDPADQPGGAEDGDGRH